ncbi:hypothetical protein WN943_005551 [Citrus x changshan-huyou]
MNEDLLLAFDWSSRNLDPFKLHEVFPVGFFSRNHESKSCKSGYGFKNEVEAKYDEDSYKKCLECFKKLPLAS